MKNPQSNEVTPDVSPEKQPENLHIADISFKNNYITSSRKKSIT